MRQYSKSKPRIVISFLGTVLDAGYGKKRHHKWRPNIALHQHDLNVVGVDLFVSDKYQDLADVITSDIHATNPDTTVNLVPMTLARYDVLQGRLAKARDTAQTHPKSGINTQNPAFNALIAELEQVALGSNLPILLTGETGVGKSLLAKRIFELKKSRHLIKGQFVDINCATLKGDGAMSALFGHGKGAFTGAVAARRGYLKTAHQGVLFLDEIGELGMDEQAMLLTALEEKRFYPLGADTPVASECMLIAGTNQDLASKVATGAFRSDLYARINIWQYRLPALKDRREDIEPSIAYILGVVSSELGRTCRFEQGAWRAYLAFAMSDVAVWSGNFRELTASILRLATLAKDGMIHTPLVKAEIDRLRWQWQETTFKTSEPMPTKNTLISPKLQAVFTHLDTFDRLQLQAVIDICQQHDSLASAGRELFDKSRLNKNSGNDSDRLRKYLGKFGISWHQIKSD